MALFSFGYKRKMEELKRLLDAQEYEKAALLAKEIPVQKAKSAYELNLLGKAYKWNEEFLLARDIYVHSYEIRCSRTVLLEIMDCCLEIKDLEGAELYFDEYHRVVPEDKVTQYVYRYRIEKKKKRERRLLIAILEELKALEYIEEYAYELAKQYHKAGMIQECMNECNDIILWFGFGPTVERAKALLAYYRGEISLEEIKSAGARYQMELEQRWQEEKQLEVPAEVQEEVPVEADTEVQPEMQIGVQPQDEVWAEIQPEIQPQEEPQEEMNVEMTENPGQEETYAEPVNEESQSPWEDEEREFELPEIDLSDISFDEDRTERQEVRREQESQEMQETTGTEEFYVAESAELETQNERLAELLKKKKISAMEILKNFCRMERVRKQVVKSLELALSDREKAYFVLTGEAQTGKTTLALSLIRLLYELDIVKYDRTATIDAVQLNQVSLEDYGEELKDCNLIIENAGGMTKESVDGLLRFSRGSRGKTCVILEDSVRNINKFLRAREELNSLFNNRIHLGKYNTGDLMGFAYDKIKKEDYCIDKMAAQVLCNKIDEIVRMYGNEQRLTRTMKLVDVVIARAEKRTGELLLSMAADGKIQQGNYMVITLEDVMN